jgi:plastocyanin
MRFVRLGGLFVSVALALAACGGSASPAASTAASAAASTAASAAASTAASAAASAGTGGGAACAKNNDTAGTGAVTIKDFKFDPVTVTIKAGEGVKFSNNDTTAHTATLVDGSCGTDSIAPSTSATLVFSKAGTYQYHCAIHASMPTATVVVQ